MSKLLLASIFIIFAAVFARFSLFADRNPIPRHLMGHHIEERENFLSEEIVEKLLANTRKSSPIFSTIKEPAVFKTTEDNIGEAEPILDEAAAKKLGRKCRNKLYTLDNSGKNCILPGRVDVGLHYMKTGGPEAKKESTALLTSRIQPFLHYILNYKEDPVTKALLESPEMIKFAKTVCPADKQYVDPFQFNYVVQVPGQTVATHVDGVYFRHVSRYQVPQWLLSCLHFSGLAKDDYVNQVQIVGYYHKWKDSRKGQFLFWNDPDTRKPQVSHPNSRSANSVDGSKIVHAAVIYHPERDPPIMPRAARNTLEYRKGKAGEHMWDIKSDNKVLQSYPEDDLRFSAVYRCKCFKDKADKELYEKQQLPENAWNTTYVIDMLRKDMDKRGILAADASIGKHDLAMLLLDTYVKYPLSPDAIIPYNWCAIPEDDRFSFLKPVFDLFCK